MAGQAFRGSDADDLEDMQFGGTHCTNANNKALSSKYRGVCWNRKNRRWQAAINSSGTYLYLGSYATEEEAAVVFDKAAVRVRGKKARLNFDLDDYMDEYGGVLPDPHVESILLGACDPTKPKRASAKGKRGGQAQAAAAGGGGVQGSAAAPSSSSQPADNKASAEIALQALARLCGPQQQQQQQQRSESHRAGPSKSVAYPGIGVAIKEDVGATHQAPWALGPPEGIFGASCPPARSHQAWMEQAALAPEASLHPSGRRPQQPSLGGSPVRGLQQQQQQQYGAGLGVVSSGAAPVSAPISHDIFALLQSKLPAGSQLDSIVPSTSSSCVGVLYKIGNQSRRTGAAIWDSSTLRSLGQYMSEADAKQACLGALNLLGAGIGQEVPKQQQQQPAQMLLQPQSSRAQPVAVLPQPAVPQPPQPAVQQRRQGVQESPLLAGASGIGWGPHSTSGSDAQATAPPIKSRPSNKPALQAAAPSPAAGAATEAVNPAEAQPSPALWAVSEPDPVILEDAGADRSSSGGATQEASGESPSNAERVCLRRPRDADDWELMGAMEGSERQRKRARAGAAAAPITAPTLQQLAHVDVQEALRMFHAYKQHGAK